MSTVLNGFCELCRQQHITENKSHSLVASNSESFEEEKDNLDVCQNPDHDLAKLKYFCNSSNCQSVLCTSCALDDHRDINKHELENIEEAFSRKRKQFRLHIKPLQWQILKVESRSQKVQNNINTLVYEKNEVKKIKNAKSYRGFTVLQIKKQKLVDKYDIKIHT